jgi:hypothetical protein
MTKHWHEMTLAERAADVLADPMAPNSVLRQLLREAVGKVRPTPDSEGLIRALDDPQKVARQQDVFGTHWLRRQDVHAAVRRSEISETATIGATPCPTGCTIGGNHEHIQYPAATGQPSFESTEMKPVVNTDQPDDCRELFEAEAARLGVILERSKLHPENYLHAAACIAWCLWQKAREAAWLRTPK